MRWSIGRAGRRSLVASALLIIRLSCCCTQVLLGRRGGIHCQLVRGNSSWPIFQKHAIYVREANIPRSGTERECTFTSWFSDVPFHVFSRAVFHEARVSCSLRSWLLARNTRDTTVLASLGKSYSPGSRLLPQLAFETFGGRSSAAQQTPTFTAAHHQPRVYMFRG